ncbi:glycosyltransferase [Lactobacillus amylovorus]|uniref:glycosyltransferase n=1 Tax=Lactobacillus amylovorus TaxID=1604 RepID=UPI00232EA5A8|nr:glycosyltransferase [Lactobacillus amylovorus]MDB6228668.1 glycosyltransferase [Lactobacillus amylovorus]
MIRIAVVMGKMHSGGKKNLVMEYYRHINRQKIQFDFICDSDSNAIPEDEIRALGGKVFKITPYQNILKNMADMRKIFKEGHYKIVHGYNNTLNVFAMLAAKQAKVPIRINESISMGANSGDWKNGFKKILKPLNKLGATNYMANGETCGKWQFGARMFNSGRVKVFKTVIDASKNLYDPELRNKTRKNLNLKDNLVIGHIGRLTEQKNTLFLIDIFNAIQKIQPNARLLIVGDGNLREKMLKKINEYGIREKVVYLGRTEDIHRLYNAMDCFVLPSIYEGLPVVGVEAETSGLPMFFSTAVPEESSPCKDLGFFIDLKLGPQEWAKIILKNTMLLKEKRSNRVKDIREKGFDSNIEANKLMKYYVDLYNKKLNF